MSGEECPSPECGGLSEETSPVERDWGVPAGGTPPDT